MIDYALLIIKVCKTFKSVKIYVLFEPKNNLN